MSYTNHPPPNLAPIIAYFEANGLGELSGMVDSVASTHVAMERDTLSAIMFLAAQAIDQRNAPVKLVFAS